MDGRIGRLHCHYHIWNEPGAAPAIATRLDRVAREQLATAYGEALEQVLADDPRVYVLRRVDASLALRLTSGTSDQRIAAQWGACLARDVARAIRGAAAASSPGARDADAACFASQADYVASFVADLLGGVAWSCWFYAPLVAERRSRLADTLHAVLEQNADHLPGILAGLHRNGTLGRALDALDEPTRQWAWTHLRGGPALDEAALRSLIAATLRLVERLELWHGTSPSLETLVASYVATRPFAPDWRDPSSLASGIVALLRFLQARGYLRSIPKEDGGTERTWPGDQAPTDLADTGTADGPPPAPAAFLSRLDQALSELDWLDRAALRYQILQLLFASPTGELRQEGPRPPTIRGPTPRQQQLLTDILDALRRTRIFPPPNSSSTPDMALRLYATLLDHHPGWAGDVLAPEMIQRLLVACQWLRQTPSPAAAIAGLRQRNVERVLVALAPGDHMDAKASLVFLAGLGASGLAVVEAILAGESAVGRTSSHPGSPDPSTGSGGQAVSQDFLTRTSGEVTDEILTPCAGTALLIRALLDLRLPTLFEPASLLALFLRWAGVTAIAEGWIDPGLLVLAGLSEVQHKAAPGEPGPLTSTEDLVRHWRAAGPATLPGNVATWLRTLAGQRVLAGDALHLYSLPLATGGYALVAGDATAALWPLGQVIETSDQAGEVVAGWLAAWATAMGRPPVLVAEDPLLATARSSDAEVAALTSDQALTATHVAGWTRITAAFEALAPGQLGLPAIDLAVTLAAGVLLRLWARWLRSFGESSVPYLLDKFIRRPGTIWVTSTEIVVTLDRRPLDIVLEMAGYLGEIDRVPWLGNRRVRFQLRGVG
jgi:hypothetical protein